MWTVRRLLTAVAMLVVHGFGFAEDGVNEPAFAAPVLLGGDLACGSQPISAVRIRDNSVLNVQRGAVGTPAKPFLAVGPQSNKSDQANCTIDLRFERPLAEARTLGMDFRGTQMKDPGTTVHLLIEIGSQRHVFDYAKGRVVDGSTHPVLKRFQLADLPAGTTHVRISISGKATRIADADSALIGFESLALCFVEVEEPEFCGASGYPNPRLAP